MEKRLPMELKHILNPLITREHHMDTLTYFTCASKNKQGFLRRQCFSCLLSEGRYENHTNPADGEQQSRPIGADSSEAESKFPVK